MWNTPALAHMVSPLFIVVMRIWFLFIKSRFDNLGLVPFFLGGNRVLGMNCVLVVWAVQAV